MPALMFIGRCKRKMMRAKQMKERRNSVKKSAAKMKTNMYEMCLAHMIHERNSNNMIHTHTLRFVMFPIFLPQSLITFSSCFAHGCDSHIYIYIYRRFSTKQKRKTQPDLAALINNLEIQSQKQKNSNENKWKRLEQAKSGNENTIQ